MHDVFKHRMKFYSFPFTGALCNSCANVEKYMHLVKKICVLEIKKIYIYV